jgi:putative ABC transport system substrate-binding protein
MAATRLRRCTYGDDAAASAAMAGRAWTAKLGRAQRIAELSGEYRLPSIAGNHEYVQNGGSMSYGPSLASSFQRAAGYVDRILKGAKPADIPVEQPIKFELVINLTTAKALRLTIPEAFLLRADEVIE